MVKLTHSLFPETVRTLALISHAFIVGSSPEKLILGDNPATIKDYDLIVEPEYWETCCLYLMHMNRDIQFNSFGGVKISVDGLRIDVWMESLYHHINSGNSAKVLFQPYGNRTITIS